MRSYVILPTLILLAHTAPLMAQTSVAVIDVPKIFQNHARFKAAMEGIKNEVKQYEAFLRTEQDRIQKLQEKARTYNPASAEYKTVERQVTQESSDLKVKMTLKRKEFMEREAREYFKAYKEVEHHVNEFARTNGISLVLRFNSQPMNPQNLESIRQGVNRPVVYQRQLDISDLILQRLNRGATAPQTATGPFIPGVPK